MKAPLASALLTALLLGCGGGSGAGSASPGADADGDGLSDQTERQRGSDPDDPHDPVRYGDRDHDGDGTPNGADGDYTASADDDGDGLDNEWEYRHGLDPRHTEILLEEERLFSAVTTDYAWLKLRLRAPNGRPIANQAFTIRTDDPALLRPIYTNKGWASDDEGRIEAAVIALGSGRSNLYLASVDDPDRALVIRDIDSTLAPQQHNPEDAQRRFSSIKDNSAPGSGNARSMLLSSAAWTPQTKTRDEWLELPVPEGRRAIALLVQGRADTAHWVSKLKISYEIAPGYREYAHGGQEFNANADRNSLVRIPFQAPPGVSHIRVHPTRWFITPAMRVALELGEHPHANPIDRDGDSDGLNDLLEARLGSDPDDADSPRLHNPGTSDRTFSSLAAGAVLGGDGGDGRIGAAAWRPAADDATPWTTLALPEGSKLVGLELQGDTVHSRWVSELGLADSSMPGLRHVLLDGEHLTANSDAGTRERRWLSGMEHVRTLRLEPRTWSGGGSGMRAAAWVVDAVAAEHDDPLLRDEDGDGLNTLQEQALGADSQNADSDGDGLSDGAELRIGSNPTASDSDGDGLSDRVEQLLGTDLADAASPGLGGDDDLDQDGLTSAYELAVLNTDPAAADSDGDSLDDREEIRSGSDPLLASSPVDKPLIDRDDDGLNHAREHLLGTDPLRRDSDGDGLIDGQELSLPSDPLDGDSPVPSGANDADGDGLSAAREHLLDSDDGDADSPLRHGDADLDGDGLPNAADPDYLAGGDWDGDGVGNQLEYDTGGDPRNANSPTLGGEHDRDGDGVVNGVDADFALLPGDDSDGDGLGDAQEYALGHRADSAHAPLTGGGADLDGDGTRNALDPDYDAEADADADGWSNGFEYRAGTDPNTANTPVDFAVVALADDEPVGSPIARYPLPAPPTSTPFYAHNPGDAARVSPVASRPSGGASRAGFDAAAVSYRVDGGTATLSNNTPRRLRDIALRNSVTGAITLVAAALDPFTEVDLQAPVANAEPLQPNPLGALVVSGLQAENGEDRSQRLPDAAVDEVERLAIGHKLGLNHPALWRRFAQHSTSGCPGDLCQSPAVARETLARLFYQQRPLALAALNAADPVRRLSWADKLALKGEDLLDYRWYLEARGLSLGLAPDSDWMGALGTALDTLGIYPLDAAAARGSSWREQGAVYEVDSDAATRTLRVKLYARERPHSLLVFSEAADGSAVGASFVGETGEFELTLSPAQWQKQRLALAFAGAGDAPLATLKLQWGSGVDSWPAQPLSCSADPAVGCAD